MQGQDVREPGLWQHRGSDVAMPGTQRQLDLLAVANGKGVFEPDTELSYDVRVTQLFLVFVLGEVLVAQPSAEIADRPRPVSDAGDPRLGCPGHRLLVERVRDELPQRKGHRPVLEDLFHVEVESPGAMLRLCRCHGGQRVTSSCHPHHEGGAEGLGRFVTRRQGAPRGVTLGRAS